MHKYYVHALAALLSGSPGYQAYQIRHPFPPYATHYAILLGLTRFVSYDMAEKLLICLILVCTAFGVRYCARAAGPSGNVLSLCAIPLLLHWSVGMGFLNYSLAVGLFFLGAGLWQKERWVWLAAVSILLALTHPIPLLLLIAFCTLDLIIRWRQSRVSRGMIVSLAIELMCFVYPLLSVDRSRSAANLRLFALHKDALISSVVLFGLSPFDTRSRNLFINAYRLGLYALLFACLALAAGGLLRRFRERTLRSSDAMLLLAVALLLAIPILPPSMNGSDYFATRLMIIPWLAAIVAAAGYAAPERLNRIVPVLAVVLAIFTLVPAEIFFRPVAKQLAGLEMQPLPAHSEGLAMMDPAMLKGVRVQHQLGFNPYLWSGALPIRRADDVMLNSPFMDQKITPLMPAAGGDLLIARMPSADEAERLINGNIDLLVLPPAVRSGLLASTRFVVYVGTPGDAVSQSLAAYHCASHDWYLICLQ
jgi:hypothetical protein